MTGRFGKHTEKAESQTHEKADRQNKLDTRQDWQADIPCSQMPDASEILYTGRPTTAAETLYYLAKPTTMAVLSDAAGRKDKDYATSAVAAPH
ncbi:hypothetical protein Pmani_011793 [Petrolisthes manimaculis]|uniref:Uncharacterized protein n=1 Tax=Petrolisthes manimaculis TaxID=1843537 RepID=A0AAE1PYH4_9EUCA|nr:hypothetical protein Pmani_011793 [Petrolisthes manimaculis]